MRAHADHSNLLIFLHIPKNGGTTLNNIIRRQCPGQTVFWFSYDRPELILEFEAMDEKRRAELCCLGGHIPFGIHEEFPGTSKSYITMLRDPVARFIDEAIRTEGEGFQKELRKLHRVNHTLFMLSNTWKRLFPRKLRNAPGLRHIVSPRAMEGIHF